MNTETKNNEILEQEELDHINSEDYQKILDEEQKAFEEGVDDDEPIVEMEEEDINDQTLKFLKNRAERKK